MAILQIDVDLEEHKAYRFFQSSIRSEATRSKYTFYLKKYMEYLNCFDPDVLLAKTPRDIEKELIEFIIKMKEDGNKNYYAITNYITAIVSFYKINDILLNKAKISKFMPEQKIRRKDKPYTHKQISKLLEIADERMRAVILLLASSGMRIGALPDLTVGNLKKLNEENDIYKITVYENSNEDYITFSSPECSKVIDSYLDMRSRYGEQINDNSPLIREQFDLRDQFAILNPKTIKSKALARKLVDLAERAGIRVRGLVLVDTDKKIESGSLRKDVAIAHGFRKFFTTMCINSEVNPEIRELLLGHKIGLAGAYYRPSQDQMLAEYMKALNNTDPEHSLIINEEHRLKMKIEKLEVEKTQIQALASELGKVKQAIGM